MCPPAQFAFVQAIPARRERKEPVKFEGLRPSGLHVRTHFQSPQRRKRMQAISMATQVTRREFAQIIFSGAGLAAAFSGPFSSEAVPSPFATPMNLISRVAQKAPPRPETKLFEDDIYYPDYFAGVWDTESKLISVTCPAGYKLFGRPGSFENAQHEVNKTLKYASRFVRSGKYVVADRAFNVKAIAEATMGPSSVLACSMPGNNPNRLSATLRPNGADGGLFLVSMKALARQQQEGPLPGAIGDPDVRPAFISEHAPRESSTIADVDGVGLYTSEMVRQEVRLETEDLRVTPSIKEVETTTLFITKPMDENCIEAWQKTSTYLTRSSLQYVDAHGRPTDVRWYKLKYYRKTPRQ